MKPDEGHVSVRRGDHKNACSLKYCVTGMGDVEVECCFSFSPSQKFLFHSMESLCPVNCLQIGHDSLSQFELNAVDRVQGILRESERRSRTCIRT